MRAIELRGADFVVENDPHQVLGDLMAYMASAPSPPHEEILASLAPDGDGYSLPEDVGVFRAEADYDIPDAIRELTPELDPDREELWIAWRVIRQGRSRITRYAWLPGDELRALYQRARALWRAQHGT